MEEIRRQGGRLAPYQQDAWRGNRRLLPSQPDSMQVGEIVVFLHLPCHGVWSIARVTGGYRYEISTKGNAVDGTPDYGHIRDVELLTEERGIDPVREGVSGELRRSMRPPSRMWSSIHTARRSTHSLRGNHLFVRSGLSLLQEELFEPAPIATSRLTIEGVL